MKEWLEKLKDPSRDVYERRYRLLSAISIVTLFLWLIVAAIVEFRPERTLFFAMCDLLFVPTMIYTLRSGRIQLGAGASGIGLVFVMLPYAFFNNGGIYAGAPNWCIIATVFITLTVRGRLRIFLLVSNAAVTTLCYVLTNRIPELVEPFTTATAYVDSLSSLIITGVMTGSMFLFQLYMSRQERDILREQQREISELNQAQNRFFSSMSHEIRTPINTIIGLNEMILREEISDEVLEDAQNIEAASKVLLQTVNDILEMSKLESGGVKLSRADYRVEDLLAELAGMMGVRAREKGLDFQVHVDPQMPSVLRGDEMRVKQVLLNVLANAVKYTRKGSVTLSVRGQRGEDGAFSAVCSVADTGIGIRKESIPHLFTAFKRVDEQQNRQIEGTGLGLAIVKQLLDLMGGEISVNSIYTKGSTFIIELPQQVVDETPVGQIDLNSVKGEGFSRSRELYYQTFEAPKARVLAVDDTPANLMVAQKLLRATQVQFDTAESGAEALRMTARTHYDVILMDHQMPGMDGIECLKRIRAQAGGLCQDSRIVALTANAGEEMAALYRREGFQGYLVKPVRGETLERELLRQLPGHLVQVRTQKQEVIGREELTARENRVKKQVLVTVDSCCDLPAELTRREDIDVIPFCVRTERALFMDGEEAQTAALVGYMESGRRAVSMPQEREAYEGFFAQCLLKANNVIHITASRMVGGGYDTASAAAETFHNVTVVDGGQLSSGTGLLALYAARMARREQPVEEIVAGLKRLRPEVFTSFVIENVDYLHRAGRVGRGVKLITEALFLHPEFEMRKGRLRTARLFLGSKARVQRRYVEAVLRNASNIDREFLFITHVALPAADCARIEEQAKRLGGFKTVIVQNASSAITANCGRGTFGLIFRRAMSEDERVLL